MIEGLLLNISQRIASFLSDGDISGIVGGQGVGGQGGDGGAAGDVVSDVVTNVTNYATQTPPPANEGGGMMLIIGYAVVMIVALYFLMYRGPKKRERKMKELQAGIRTGDNVVVTGGMFGRIADVGDDCFIVEFGTNRGIRIPVLKSDVLGVREPKLTPPPKSGTE